MKIKDLKKLITIQEGFTIYVYSYSMDHDSYVYHVVDEFLEDETIDELVLIDQQSCFDVQKDSVYVWIV